MKNALELQNVSKSFKGFEMKDMTFSPARQDQFCFKTSANLLFTWCQWGREKYYDSSDYGYDSQRQRNNLCVRKEY